MLKAVAAGLVHKTEAGAVKLDLRAAREVRAAYHGFASAFGDRLAGVLVQPMVSGGVEVLIGVAQEPVFGPLVVFGLGGVATDVLGGHAARLSPLTDADARDLARAVRADGTSRGVPGRAFGQTSPRWKTSCCACPGSPMTCLRSLSLT